MFRLPNKPYHIIQKFLTENKPLVYKYLIKKIQYAMNNDIEKVELFEFPGEGTRHVAVVREHDFEKVLMDAITECSDVEQYELASKAQQVLQSYRDKQINKLLNEIKHEE